MPAVAMPLYRRALRDPLGTRVNSGADGGSLGFNGGLEAVCVVLRVVVHGDAIVLGGGSGGKRRIEKNRPVGESG